MQNTTTIHNPAFAIKGGMFTLTIIKLINSNIELFKSQLQAKIQQAPNFFDNAPVIVDLKAINDNSQLDLAKLCNILQQNKLIIVGVKNASKNQQLLAKSLQLAIIKSSPTAPPKTTTDKLQPNMASASPNIATSSTTLLATCVNKLIETPVRSGQQVCAPNGDLIVLNQVSPGAELLAAGNIHVYGPLRGRALAGINGNQAARIFCSSLEAELVSIAGNYKISEDIDANLWQRPAMITIKDKRLQISQL